jgi:hypothetical protein
VTSDRPIPSRFPDFSDFQSHLYQEKVTKADEWYFVSILWVLFRFWIMIFIFTVSFKFMQLLFVQEIIRLINVGARSKQWVCGRLLAGIAGSNPSEAWTSVSCECCLLSCRGLCDGMFTRPGESYRLCVCVCVCVCVCTRAYVCVTILSTPTISQ